MNRRNKTLGEALREGKARMKKAGKDAIDAAFLLEKAAGMNRSAFFLREEEILSEDVLACYEGYLAEREAGRPTQYILGEWEFMGLPFAVGEGVLIPRGDTEVLVEAVLEKQQEEGFCSVLDIGTGSGCIPVSLGHYGSFEQLMAVDISPRALGYAVENAKRNQIMIAFYESDLFANVPAEWKGGLDAIVSNPPYISKTDMAELMVEVKDHEPHNALYGGEDGLDFYRAIVEQAKEWLKDGGWLFFEIGYDQGEALCRLLQENGYDRIEIRKDLAGLDRVAIGRKERG
ncbi:MAG: peptide chain release factor N(5)-glutamine methyltransferase [Bacillota bacterium]|nr:peptide chain release factor N(5)-glutamine methyltransferase [Bacillota bacterium]